MIPDIKSKVISGAVYTIAGILLLLAASVLVTNNEILVNLALLYVAALSVIVDRLNNKRNAARRNSNAYNKAYLADYLLAAMDFLILFIFIFNFLFNFQRSFYGIAFYIFWSLSTILSVSLESDNFLRKIAIYSSVYLVANLFFMFVSISKGFPVLPDVIIGATSLLLTSYVRLDKLDSKYYFLRIYRRSSW
jgi:hypothetical protein